MNLNIVNFMKTTFLTASVVAAALAIGSLNLCADHVSGVPHKEKSANDIIGTKVVNAQNEDLGKVQDLIINVDSGHAPYAVIATGGLKDRSKVAVPLSAMRCAADGKSMVLMATKEQLQSASKSPTGAWTPVANEAWTKKVDGFYGQPMARERSLRDLFRDTDDARTYVRDPAPKGAELLTTPQDLQLGQKITEKVEVINVQVLNGVAHLYGTVENESSRQKLENQVRSVEGVMKVESHLRIKGQ
jgi:sporulation protein YlmC with PRC-barrel domain